MESEYIISEVKQIDELGLKYWEGPENKFIRYWVYVRTGLSVVNEFKYYGAALYGFYYAAKNYEHILYPALITLALAVIGIPILLIIGRYQLQKVQKTTQYVNTISGDIFQFLPIKLQIRLTEAVESILKKING